MLPYLGIQLEDKKPGEPSTWKFVDKEELIKEYEAKKQAKLAKIAAAELAQKKKSTSGADWFKVMEGDKYSKYDETGLPTHDKTGKEISEA